MYIPNCCLWLPTWLFRITCSMAPSFCCNWFTLFSFWAWICWLSFYDVNLSVPATSMMFINCELSLFIKIGSLQLEMVIPVDVGYWMILPLFLFWRMDFFFPELFEPSRDFLLFLLLLLRLDNLPFLLSLWSSCFAPLKLTRRCWNCVFCISLKGYR